MYSNISITMKTAHCLSLDSFESGSFYYNVHFKHVSLLSRLHLAVAIGISECYLFLLLKEGDEVISDDCSV